MSNVADLWADICLFFIKAIILVYDLFTFPLYLVLQQPWRAREATKIIQAKREVTGDRSSPMVSEDRQLKSNSFAEGCTNINELFAKMTQRFKDMRCIGFREVMMEEKEKQMDGTTQEKKILSDNFKWMSYAQTDKRIEDIMRGLILLGVKGQEHKVVLMMENRIEWMMTAHAVLRTGAVLVTVNPNISSSKLLTILSQVKPRLVISSCGQILQKVLKANSSVDEPSLKFIVVTEDKARRQVVNKAFLADDDDATETKIETNNTNKGEELPSSPAVKSLADLEKSGGQARLDLMGNVCKSNDLAMIVYKECKRTQGLNGVMITHKNLISSLMALDSAAEKMVSLCSTSMYPAFLPSTHVTEFVTQHVMLMNGIPVGYSSFETLTSKSSFIKNGSPGDCCLMKPKLIHATPTDLDFIRQEMSKEISSRTAFSQKFFDFALQYKNYWSSKGYNTTLTNLFVFGGIGKLLGGKTSVVIASCSDEVVSPTTQAFMRSVLDAKIMTGFSATETTGFSTLKLLEDTINMDSCGAVLPGFKIKLKDFSRASYLTSDHPNSRGEQHSNPRGEILVGGDAVSPGYFNNMTLTDESFEVDSNDVSWFRTGIIGELHSTGKLEVIDSKENLVKLEFGDSFTPIGKSEAEIRSCSFLRNICLYANEQNNFILAFVSPCPASLQSLCKTLDIEEGSLSFKEMCSDPEVQAEVTKAIVEHGVKAGLPKKLLPSKVKLCTEEWTPESGLVTADMKPIRHEIARLYSRDINRMFGNVDQNANINRRVDTNPTVPSPPTRHVTNVTVQMETREGIEMSTVNTNTPSNDNETNSS